MLFYVQIKWNHEGRISLDKLWGIEFEEAEHTQETIKSGMCVGIWKAAAQKRVIAVVDIEDTDKLESTALGRCPCGSTWSSRWSGRCATTSDSPKTSASITRSRRENP